MRSRAGHRSADSRHVLPPELLFCQTASPAARVRSTLRGSNSIAVANWRRKIHDSVHSVKHNVTAAALLSSFETCAVQVPQRANVQLRRAKSGEIIMVEIVSRWGNSALLFTFLLITYAVLITLR